jgi:hypothetical protein
MEVHQWGCHQVECLQAECHQEVHQDKECHQVVHHLKVKSHLAVEAHLLQIQETYSATLSKSDHCCKLYSGKNEGNHK